MLDIENYIIPTVATEGIWTDSVEYDNKELLSKKNPVIIFCPHSKDYYKAYFKKLIKQYKYTGGIVFKISSLLLNLANDEDIEVDTLIDIPGEVLSDLGASLRALNFTNDTNIHKSCRMIMNTSMEFMKNHNILIGLYSRNVFDYTIPILRQYPSMIVNPALWKSFMIELPKDIKLTIKDVLYRNRQFDRVFGMDLDKYFKPVDATKISLYHVSKNPRITHLEPRQTVRPLNDVENTRIARISACDTVKKCIAAVNAKVEPGKWHVYKLVLTPDSVVGKPDKFYVPDVSETDEYWVLTKTQVKKIDTIIVK